MKKVVFAILIVLTAGSSGLLIGIAISFSLIPDGMELQQLLVPFLGLALGLYFGQNVAHRLLNPNSE